MIVHRVREPERPRDLGEFVTWIEHMNADMLAAGVEVGDRYDFDVVHGHDWLVAVAGDHLAKRFRCPLVVTIHATEYGRHQGWVDKHPQSHIHGVERWMANRAERVITCSAYMREHVADIYGLEEERITVIPNGIDPTELVPVDDLDALRARFAAPDERLVLLVGRLVYEKGFQLALEALPGLIERLGNVRFIVAGSGTAEAELRAQATRARARRARHFLGWIGDDVLHSLYRIADLTVVPSLYEPFGLVALEAMASGCPCIVADTGGLREIVPPDERVGLRFNGGDPEHLAVMVERLLTDDELRDRLVAEASEHVLSFDWADVARQVSDVYAEVTARARQPLTARTPRGFAPLACNPATTAPGAAGHRGRRRADSHRESATRALCGAYVRPARCGARPSQAQPGDLRGIRAAASRADFGRYQFHSPSSFIVAGSSTPRMIVASIRTAAARPTPICLNSIVDSVAKIANTATIIDRRARHDAGGRLDAVRDRVRRSRMPRSTASRIRLRMNTW